MKHLRRTDRKTKKNHQQFDDGFDFTVEDSIEKFLGVEMCRSENKVCMRQPHLIERIIDAVEIYNKHADSKPSPSTHILHKYEN